MTIPFLSNHIKESIRVASKAGFISRKIWNESFARGKRRWRDRQWQNLLSSKYFQTVPDFGFNESAVTLTEKGKALAMMLGLDPVSSPQAKNFWHDEELIRFALFLERQGWISSWMTEQEIKCGNRSESFFKNQDRPPKIPDLVIEWNRPHDKILWAIELERTRKEFTRYYDMVGAYRGISRIDSVLVVVDSESIEDNIKRAQSKLNYPQNQRPMLFASLDQVTVNPVECEIRIGPNRTTLGKAAFALVGAEPLKIDVERNSGGPNHGPNHSPNGASRF